MPLGDIPRFLAAVDIEEAKTVLELENVDNTSDENKPVSIATNAMIGRFEDIDALVLIPDGVTDNTAEMESLTEGAIGTDIGFPTGRFLVDDTFENGGARLLGPGKVFKEEVGGARLQNNYTNEQFFFGIEYTHGFRTYTDGKGNSVNIGLYGDSTLTDPFFSAGYDCKTIIEAIVKQRGVPAKTLVTNHAVSGTKWSDLNAIPGLSATRHLIFIKYGINDGNSPTGSPISLNTRLETLRDTMDSKLAAIRAATNGSLTNLTIVLVGPNGTDDLAEGKNEEWYTGLRVIYELMARKHKCLYFDTYSYFQDATPRTAANIADGVHYGNIIQTQLWGKIFECLVGDHAYGPAKSNFLYNETNTQPPYREASAAVSTYPAGLLASTSTLAQGFPGQGLMFVVNTPDNEALQFSADTTTGMIFGRAGNVANGWRGGFQGMVHNRPYSDGVLNADLPADFNQGINHARVTPTEGFPLNGMVTTCINVDATAFQIITNYDGGTSRMMFRTGLVGGAWQAWKEIGLLHPAPVAETPTPTHTLIIKDASGAQFKVVGIPVP